jgi:DNA ligase-associated metallophosphoesterase
MHSITKHGLEAITRSIADEQIKFFADKAAFWILRSTLLVADLHWGKTATFQAAGIPIPEAVLADDLKRLTTLIGASGAKKVLVLGDLIHSKGALTPQCCEMISAWRRSQPVSMAVVLGNHDRAMRSVPDSWDIENLGESAIDGPFCFRHEPHESLTHHVWAGHMHPMLRMEAGPDRLRLPCFWLRERMTLLPAFSVFTRGSNIKLQRRECAMMVHERRIFAVGDITSGSATENQPLA